MLSVLSSENTCPSEIQGRWVAQCIDAATAPGRYLLITGYRYSTLLLTKGPVLSNKRG